MFSGLFKKKDKKLRGIDGEMEPEKMSGEFSPTMKEDGSPMSPSTEGFPANALQPQRTGSRGKLQKANPKGENLSPNTLQPNEQFGPQKQPSPQNGSAAEPVSVNGVGPQSTMRIVQSDEDMQSEKPQSFRTKPQDQSQAEKPQSLRIKTQDQGQAEQRGKLSEITNMLRPGSNDGLPKREKVKKAKRRVELDDFDSSPDELDKPGDPFADNNADLRTGSRQGQDRSPNQAVLQEPAERLSESPVQVSPVGATRSLDTDDSNQTAATLADDSSAEDRGASPPSDNDFEHVGADAKHMPSQAQLQPQSNSRTGAFSPVSPTNPAAPAPLQITKQPGPQLRQQQQERTSPSGDSPGSSIPPQPTRMAPIPGKAPIPGAFPITPTPSTNEIPQLRQPLSLNNLSGSRSNTPTLTPSKQISAPALNTAFNAQQPPPLSTSPTSSGSSATPTATTPKTPPSHPAQPMTQDAVSRTPSHSSSLPAWSDAALRAYMDDTSHVKNLLLVVKDTSGLVPLGPDDEVVKAMWREQREGLKRLERGLDGLLEGWIERKKGGRGGGSKLGVRM